MTLVQPKPLGQLLVGRGALQPMHLQLALQEQNGTSRHKLLGEILVEQKWCSPELVAEALAQSYDIPFARITPRLADPRIIGILPRTFLERHCVLPLFKVEAVLTVAMAEPADVFLVEEIARTVNCRVQVVAATARDIRATLQAYLPQDQTFVVDDVVDEHDPAIFALVKVPAAPCALAAACEPAVLQLVRATICTAVHERATEIHLEPGDRQFRIRYRIDGRLIEKRRPPGALQSPIIYRLKWMAELDPAQSSRPQAGLMRLTVDGRPVALAVATAPGRQGEKLVLRIADADRAPVRLEKLGFSYDTFKQWRKVLANPQGLILVSGPAGGGKRTMLYSCLRELNADDLNVCTVEDPVEASLPGVNQVQIDHAAGFGFGAALAAVLAQSPDVLMISDLRDRETARLAAQTATDGRLLLAGASAPDALAAVAWLLNLGVEPYLLGAALAGVLAQRLVRKLCPACKEPYEVGAGERRQLERHVGPVQTLYRHRGCDRCGNRGFAGRIGIHELLIPDDAFRECLSRGAPLAELRELARAAKIKSLRADGLEKAKAGITTLEEVYRLTA